MIWDELDPDHYTRETTHPAIVLIQANEGRPPATREALMTAIAAEVAHALSLEPERIWAYYEELKTANIRFN